MISVDTNLVVRLVTADEPAQAARAAALFRKEDVHVSDTVLLETEWVLRHAYALDGVTIRAALRRLLGLPNVHVADLALVANALSWNERGLDFADALHLAASARAGAKGFATFDRRLARRADKVSGVTAFVP